MPSGKCSYCGETFSTKDGGAHCSVCNKIACPKCEPQHFGETGAEKEMCILCFISRRIPDALKKLKSRLLSNDIVN